MADVAATLAGWSATTGSNSPAGTTTVGPGVDDNFREVQGVVVRGLSHKGSDIASATSTDIGAVEGSFHDITGTTTITGFGTIRAGIMKFLKFEGILTLTHNSTNLILLGSEDRTTAAGDVGIYISEGSGNWRELGYFPVATNPGTNLNITSATAHITMTSADAGASGAPTINLNRLSPTPASNDDIGIINFKGKDNAGNTDTYAFFNVGISDPTSGSEDARFEFATMVAGALAERVFIGHGLFTFGSTDPGADSMATGTLKLGASADSFTGRATQAIQETSTSTAAIVVPATQQFHPSAAKGWVKWNSGDTVVASYNVAAGIDNGTGDFTIQWDTDFSSVNFAVSAISTSNVTRVTSQAAGDTRIFTGSDAATAQDATSAYCIAFGDQ